MRVGARGALGTQAIADTTDLPSCHRSQSAWREFSSECVQIKEDRYHEMKNTARMAEFKDKLENFKKRWEFKRDPRRAVQEPGEGGSLT